MNNDTKTTVVGVLAGILTYWGSTGFSIPANKQQAASLVGSALIMGLGYLTNKPDASGVK
jgi:hypothetical protein